MKKFTLIFRTKGDTRYTSAATLAPREFHTTFLKATNDRYTPYTKPQNQRGNQRGNKQRARGDRGRGRAQFNGRGYNSGRGQHNPQWPKSESFSQPKPLDKIDRNDANKVISLLKN